MVSSITKKKILQKFLVVASYTLMEGWPIWHAVLICGLGLPYWPLEYYSLFEEWPLWQTWTSYQHSTANLEFLEELQILAKFVNFGKCTCTRCKLKLPRWLNNRVLTLNFNFIEPIHKINNRIKLLF